MGSEEYWAAESTSRSTMEPANAYDPIELDAYFASKPFLVAGRVGEVASALARALGAAAAHRGDRRRQFAAYREIIESLGPAFVKVAQTLSTRPDLIGEELASELREFQDRAAAFATPVAFRIIEEELGRPVSEVFQSIGDKPIAAASLGQVYRATLAGEEGADVAVKVQRPGVLAKIAVDVFLLRQLLQAVKVLAGMTRDLRLIADEVAVGLYGELDYRVEAENSRVFARAHEGLDFIVVPEPVRELTTERVLVTEWVEGKSPADLFRELNQRPCDGGGDGAAAKLRKLVDMGVSCSLSQLLTTGVMHADPHPGNLIYTPDGRLAYVDFGLLTRVEPRHRGGMLDSIVHMSSGDWNGFVRDLDRLELLKPTVRRNELEADLAKMMGKSSFKDFSKLLQVMAKLGVRYKFTLPPFYVLVVRSLATLEGIALQVDPDFKIVSAARGILMRDTLLSSEGLGTAAGKTLLGAAARSPMSALRLALAALASFFRSCWVRATAPFGKMNAFGRWWWKL